MSPSWGQLLHSLKDRMLQRQGWFFHFLKKYVNFGSTSLLDELSNWPQLGLILKSCVCSLKWAQVEVNCFIRLKNRMLQREGYFFHFLKKRINFGSMSLLNELSNWPQLGLILKSCVCSLKWAQIEVNCSIRWKNRTLQRKGYFFLFLRISINFGRLLLLNKLSNWPQFGLILKSSVCSLKWA